MSDTCDAKIRPFPDATELQCERPYPHFNDLDPTNPKHEATLRDYAYPGSRTVLDWWEGDRRTFRGEWAPCSRVRCTLPAGHHGNHAP